MKSGSWEPAFLMNAEGTKIVEYEARRFTYRVSVRKVGQRRAHAYPPDEFARRFAPTKREAVAKRIVMVRARIAHLLDEVTDWRAVLTRLRTLERSLDGDDGPPPPASLEGGA